MKERPVINRLPVIFDEVWAPVTQEVIPYVLPYYHVSSYGRVYSAVKENFMILTIDGEGYVYGNFHIEKDSPTAQNRRFNQTTFRINRLVLATFKPVPNWRDLECNHKDSVRSNNYIENLEWVTAKENHQHGLDFGYKQIPDIEGVKNPMAKLTRSQVLEIVDLLNVNKMNYEDIGRLYDVRGEIIRDIAAGRHWQSVTHGLLSEDAVRFSRTYTNDEIRAILNFFESKKDVLNDRSIYPSLNSIVVDCLNSTGLITNHSIESSRKTIVSYLRKSSSSANKLYQNYTYHYDY